MWHWLFSSLKWVIPKDFLSTWVSFYRKFINAKAQITFLEKLGLLQESKNLCSLYSAAPRRFWGAALHHQYFESLLHKSPGIFHFPRGHSFLHVKFWLPGWTGYLCSQSLQNCQLLLEVIPRHSCPSAQPQRNQAERIRVPWKLEVKCWLRYFFFLSLMEQTEGEPRSLNILQNSNWARWHTPLIPVGRRR